MATSGFIIFIYLIVLILFIWLNYYIAESFEMVAKTKGYYEKKYFHLCFWTGIIGYLLVIALPDLNMLNELKKINNIDEISKK